MGGEGGGGGVRYISGGGKGDLRVSSWAVRPRRRGPHTCQAEPREEESPEEGDRGHDATPFPQWHFTIIAQPPLAVLPRTVAPLFLQDRGRGRWGK